MANFLQKIFGGSKTKSYSIYQLLNGIDQAFKEDNTIDAVSNSYNSNPWVNIAIDKIATNFNRAPFKIFDGDNEIVNGPVYSLFVNVNPNMSRYQLWESTISWLKIRGEAIWTFQSDFDGLRLPTEIYVHDPSRFAHVLNKESTKITMWVYTTPSGGEIPILPSELTHFKTWNTSNEWRGVNPLIPHSNILINDSLIDTKNNALIENNATPSGLLSTSFNLTDDQAKEYKEKWEKIHKGASRSGEIAVLGEDLQYQPIGLTPEEMQYIQSKKWNRSAVMAKFGVPPCVAGYKDENTPLSGTDTSEQLLQFWNVAIIPVIKSIQDKLRTDFSERWAPRLSFVFDTTAIPELQDDEDKLIDRLIAQVDAGLLTQNEARRLLHRDPVQWGATWYKDNTKTDVTVPVVAPPATKDTPFSWVTEDEPPELELAKLEYDSATVNIYEKLFKKKLNDLLFDQRCHVLSTITQDKLVTDEWWEVQKVATAEKVAQIIYPMIKELVEIDDASEFIDVYTFGTKRANGIATYLNYLKNEIKDLDKEAVRDIFNSFKPKIKQLAIAEVKSILDSFTPKKKESKRDYLEEMTEDEAEIAREVEKVYANVEKDINKLSDDEDKKSYLNSIGLGLLLFGAIEDPISRTFGRGLKRFVVMDGVSTGIQTDMYLDGREKYLKKSGDAVAVSIIEDINSNQYTKEELTDIIAHKMDISKNSAGLIAQTETTVAYNSGIQKSMIAIGKTHKKWINQGDSKVRESHRIDQVVKVNEYFTLNNGIQMLHPGAGPVGEIANCRCSMIPVDKPEGEE